MFESLWEPREPSPYELLGVTPSSTSGEIKAAYRRLALTAHPDKGGNPEHFQRLDLAYKSLLRGGGTPRVRAGARPTGWGTVRIQVSLDTLYTGATKTIELERITAGCAECSNRGRRYVGPCAFCRGGGSIRKTFPLLTGVTTEIATPCIACAATGKSVHPSEPCTACDGTRASRVVTTHLLRIPPGAADDAILPLGDHVHAVLVRTPHAVFQRENNDLLASVPVVLDTHGGLLVILTHLDGRQLAIRCPLPDSALWIVRGEGMPCDTAGGSPGNLYLEITGSPSEGGSGVPPPGSTHRTAVAVAGGCPPWASTYDPGAGCRTQ
jgi:DnaJ family protein A protein 2